MTDEDAATAREVRHAVAETARVALASGMPAAAIGVAFGLSAEAVAAIARGEPGAWDGIATAAVWDRILRAVGADAGRAPETRRGPLGPSVNGH